MVQISHLCLKDQIKIKIYHKIKTICPIKMKWQVKKRIIYISLAQQLIIKLDILCLLALNLTNLLHMIREKIILEINNIIHNNSTIYIINKNNIFNKINFKMKISTNKKILIIIILLLLIKTISNNNKKQVFLLILLKIIFQIDRLKFKRLASIKLTNFQQKYIWSGIWSNS